MAAEGRSRGPYAAAVALTAESEAERMEPESNPQGHALLPPAANPRWVRNVNDYTRRMTSEFHVSRYG
jgi:hypothetical protein